MRDDIASSAPAPTSDADVTTPLAVIGGGGGGCCGGGACSAGDD